MKITSLTLAAGALGASLLPAAALAQKAPAAAVVTVDVQRIYAECTACKAANAQLQTQVTSAQQRQQQLSTSLQADATSLRTALNGKDPAADAATKAKITAFEQKQSAQTEMQGREQTLQRNRAYVLQQINAKLGPIFQTVATARNANLVMDQQATLWNGPALDVTNDVLTQLNSQLPLGQRDRTGGAGRAAAVSEAAPAAEMPAGLPEAAIEGAGDLGPFDIRRIMAALPHRYPMLLVDRVERLVPGESIRAVKAVTINEQFFVGHFPGRPIMPGVMIIEALAQAAGILALKSLGFDHGGKLVYFMAIEEARFRRPVEPGVLLTLEVEFLQKRPTASKFSGRALIGDVLATQASFTAMIADPPSD